MFQTGNSSTVSLARAWKHIESEQVQYNIMDMQDAHGEWRN